MHQDIEFENMFLCSSGTLFDMRFDCLIVNMKIDRKDRIKLEHIRTE